MKKKLFLVLCSCFAGALALSSCGGGGGGMNSVSPLLEPFVRGNFAILFESSTNSAKVVGNGSFLSTRNTETYVAAYGVPVNCWPFGTTTGTSTVSGYANYIINLTDNRPTEMEISFYSLSEFGGGDNDNPDTLLPFKQNWKVSLGPDPTLGFALGARGEAEEDSGNTVTNYQIIDGNK